MLSDLLRQALHGLVLDLGLNLESFYTALEKALGQPSVRLLDRSSALHSRLVGSPNRFGQLLGSLVNLVHVLLGHQSVLLNLLFPKILPPSLVQEELVRLITRDSLDSAAVLHD